PRLDIRRLFVLLVGTGLGLMSCAALAMTATDNTAFTCVGDCDGSGMVTIDEIVKAVNIALAELSIDECPNLDCNGTGQVTVDCLISAVASALNGCPSIPAGSPTPTSTPTNTPATTPTVAFFTPAPDCGTFLTTWGRFGSAASEFNIPLGIAVDGHGNVFVADTGNNRIEVFSNDGTFLFTFGSLGDGDGQFDMPRGVAVDG